MALPLASIVPSANITMNRWSTRLNQTKEAMEKAQARYKKYADLKRRHEEYEVGDLVFVKLDSEQFILPKGITPKLARRYDGPFPIIEKLSPLTYKVKLPEHMGVHPVFHISLLKRSYMDENHEEMAVRRGPALVIDKGSDYAWRPSFVIGIYQTKMGLIGSTIANGKANPRKRTRGNKAQPCGNLKMWLMHTTPITLLK